MRLVVCVLCIAASARADDGDGLLTLHAEPHDGEPAAPLLTIDPTLATRFETLHADEDTATARIPLGKHLEAQLARTAWSNTDIAERGWQSSAGLTATFGQWHVGALASWNGVDGRLGNGRYLDYGVSIARTFNLSRWMTAWIALSVGMRQWTGVPPAGEANGATLTLSVGTTFR
jgi:hypothetical protein